MYNVKKRYGERRNVTAFLFTHEFPATHFNSCDESGWYSLFKFNHRGVQGQDLYNLLRQTNKDQSTNNTLCLQHKKFEHWRRTCAVVRAVHMLQIAWASASVFFLICKSCAACMRGSSVSLAPQSIKSLSISHSSSCQTLYLKPEATNNLDWARELSKKGPTWHLFCETTVSKCWMKTPLLVWRSKLFTASLQLIKYKHTIHCSLSKISSSATFKAILYNF